MRKSREFLRLKWCEGLSHRAIASSLGVSPGTVSATASRAAACGLDWVSVDGLAERALETRVYPHAAVDGARAEPYIVWIHTELLRPGVTPELLHLEYLEQHPDGYRTTTLGERYLSWSKRCRPSVRQVHRAGENIFVDYSGKRPSIEEPAPGESVPQRRLCQPQLLPDLAGALLALSHQRDRGRLEFSREPPDRPGLPARRSVVSVRQDRIPAGTGDRSQPVACARLGA